MSVGKKSSESKSMLRVKSVCTKGTLSSRMGLTADNEGNVLVCSYDNKEGIKKISQTDGTISTIEAAVIKPHDVVIDPKGNLFVVGYDPPMFVKVSPQGKVETMIFCRPGNLYEALLKASTTWGPVASLLLTEKMICSKVTRATVPVGFPKAPLIPVCNLSAPAHESILLILRTCHG